MHPGMLSKPRDRQASEKTTTRLTKVFFKVTERQTAADTAEREIQSWQAVAARNCTARCVEAGFGGLGVTGRISDIIKFLYAHDTTTVRSSHSISENRIIRCLMGVR